MRNTIHTARGGVVRLAAIATAALLVTGCESIYAPPHPLDGTNWRLSDVETSGTSTQLTPELSSRHRLSFVDGDRAQLQLDCNRGNAEWSASMPSAGNGSISFGPVASTRAYCPPPTFGGELASRLPDATRFILASDRSALTIRTPEADYIFLRD
ncbi:META domain-containing protein [Erythrobacter sp. HKB08]|uniref:META domain-containing protein n=1 Tax=Erythrobacter sp. HKB08 TaxID=2502843 RepID=UPI0010089D11|nr:META domain-containing protein [Erythrobacter sp. HKB08]